MGIFMNLRSFSLESVSVTDQVVMTTTLARCIKSVKVEKSDAAMVSRSFVTLTSGVFVL